LDSSIFDILVVTAAEAFFVLLIAYATTPSAVKVEEFRKFLWERYVGNAAGDDRKTKADRCIAYAHRDADRQINKVRGVLTFDALFFGVAKVYYAAPDLAKLTANAGEFFGRLLFYGPICFLLLAIMICLWLFVVKWSDVSIYETFEKEFDFICSVVRTRTILLHCAIYLSFVAAVISGVDLLFVIGPS
jgi:hypothetical protein